MSVDETQILPVKEDLGIFDVQIPDLPKDVVFPDEINKYLRERLQYLTHENGMLQKNYNEKSLKLKQSEIEVKALDVQLKKLQNTSSSFISSSDVANSKIVELSKKLRERTSEMEFVKTKCLKLEKRLFEIEHEDATIEIPKEKPPLPTNEQENLIKTLQEKLTSTTSKLFESRNLNVQLKNDLKLANKHLQQEIGENLETIQNATNGWRGRAQIICDLQEKNNELREKLKSYQGAKQIGEVQSKNEKKLENLNKENRILMQELQETKKKLDSARSRCKYLDMEMVVFRTKLKVANEQNERDNDHLTTLTGQMTQFQNGQNETMKTLQKQQKKLETTIKTLNGQLTKEKCIVENLQRDLRKKDAVINELTQNNHKNRICNESTENRMEIERELSRLETERLRLLELVRIGNKRLDEERVGNNNIQMQYLQERQKAAKLEAKIARFHLEQQNIDKNSIYSGYSSKSSSRLRDENLIDRLELAEENIKVLTTRLKIEKEERATDFQEFQKILLEYNEK